MTTTTGGVAGFRIVAYETPRGCAAAYYPETNPLVPLDSTAIGSNTPTSKSVIIRSGAAPLTSGLSTESTPLQALLVDSFTRISRDWWSSSPMG